MRTGEMSQMLNMLIGLALELSSVPATSGGSLSPVSLVEGIRQTVVASEGTFMYMMHLQTGKLIHKHK